MALRIQRAVDDVADMSVRLVVHTLSFLVFDDLFFLGHHRVGDGVDEVAEFVSFGPQRLLQSVGRHHLKVIGAVAAGGAVRRTADARHEAVEAAGTKILGVEKKEMFEQMRKSGAPRHLARRADVERHRHSGDRIGAVHMEHHRQAVGELVPFKRDVGGALGVATTPGHDQPHRQHGTHSESCQSSAHTWLLWGESVSRYPGRPVLLRSCRCLTDTVPTLTTASTRRPSRGNVSRSSTRTRWVTSCTTSIMCLRRF